MSKSTARLLFLRTLIDMDEEQMREAIEGLDEAVPANEIEGVALFNLIEAAIATRRVKFGQ